MAEPKAKNPSPKKHARASFFDDARVNVDEHGPQSTVVSAKVRIGSMAIGFGVELPPVARAMLHGGMGLLDGVLEAMDKEQANKERK